jgi:hypothetical protein
MAGKALRGKAIAEEDQVEEQLIGWADMALRGKGTTMEEEATAKEEAAEEDRGSAGTARREKGSTTE